jgi:hypothetical protein
MEGVQQPTPFTPARRTQGLYDIDALMRFGEVSLPLALASARKIYGAGFNPEIALEALSYFEDEGVKKLPEEISMAENGGDCASYAA